MENMGSKNLKMKLGFNLILIMAIFSCKTNSNNKFSIFVTENSKSKMYENSERDDCFKSFLYSRNTLDYKYFVVDNDKNCKGIKSVAQMKDFDEFFYKEDSIDKKQVLLNFDNHIKNFKNRIVHNLDVMLFTNRSKDNISDIIDLVPDIYHIFFKKKKDNEPIPILNILIITNADDIMEDMKNPF